MNMTHYMKLLATNQPWNLLIFMAVPIVLAETIAVTELYVLYTRAYDGPVRALNRACSIVVGIYFAGVFLYLINGAVIPITNLFLLLKTYHYTAISSAIIVGTIAYILALIGVGGLRRASIYR